MVYDDLDLLANCVKEEPAIYTTADVLEHDPLGLLGDDPANDILRLRHVKRKPSTPDYVAQRKKCDEFEKFEPIFKQCHKDLKSGKKTTVPYSRENQITPGAIFILQGTLVYVAKRGKWESKSHWNKDARLY